jgi:hypothetical protein
MTFPTSIGAAQYSALAVSRVAVPATLTEAACKAGFTASTTTGSRGDYVTMENIRDLPAFGTPANIVKVPVYGQAQTQSVGAQSDAPDLEVTLNFVPAQWVPAGSAFANPSTSLAGTGTFGDAKGDGISKLFMFALLPARPASFNTTTTGLGTVPNALWFFTGKIESMLVQPARDDAATATVALSIQSDFIGPFTQNPT